jgi:uncharacterized protein YeaO (DUF488 family)
MMIFLIKLKRVYDPSIAEDGFRILIDRLWPRGMSKEKAALALWLKDIAPSEELRQWFSHNPERWTAFKEKYLKELSEKKDLIAQIKQLEKEHCVLTLIYSSRDLAHNNAVVLKDELERL